MSVLYQGVVKKNVKYKTFLLQYCLWPIMLFQCGHKNRSFGRGFFANRYFIHKLIVWNLTIRVKKLLFGKKWSTDNTKWLIWPFKIFIVFYTKWSRSISMYDEHDLLIEKGVEGFYTCIMHLTLEIFLKVKLLWVLCCW